jgi:hypothetical protein
MVSNEKDAGTPFVRFGIRLPSAVCMLTHPVTGVNPAALTDPPSLLHTRTSFTYWDKVILPSMKIPYCLCRAIVTTPFSSQFATLSKLLSHLWWVLSNRVEDAPQIQESGTIQV